MWNSDQATGLRHLMRQTRQTRTVAICSGKGGVGKSNICLNLSILLSAGGKRVALVDADLGLGSLDVLIDLDARANLSHVIAGTHNLEQVTVDLPTGVQFVPGGTGLASLADLSDFQRGHLLRELTGLEADNDVILVDCGAGIGPSVLQFASAADTTVIVTTPEPTAVTDAYAVIKVLVQRGYEGGVSLLVNLAANRHEARDTQQRISEVARRFLGIEIASAGYVLSDPRVGEAVRRRQALVLAFPRCPASRCLAALADKLATCGGMVGQRGGFFRRVANWFG